MTAARRLSREEFDGQVYAAYLQFGRNAGRTADRFGLQAAHVNVAVRRVEDRSGLPKWPARAIPNGGA